jgi:site-specific recombinase XerD
VAEVNISGVDAAPPAPDLTALLDSWKLAMQADRKAPYTIDSYVRGVRYYLHWCGEAAPLERTTLQRWVTALLGQGAEPATARIRQQAVRRFASWLASEGEIDADPFLGLRPPKLDTKVVQVLSVDELGLMLKACAGRTLAERRDEAMLRLLAETGMRAGELLALNLPDVDLGRGLVTIRRGKGGRGRVVPFGAQTGAAVDRYLRTRRHHRLAGTAALWLTETGGRDRLSYHGLRVTLLARAATAGIEGFHLHKIRHTFASRWLASKGSEGGLMAVAGWSSREMVDRYARATAGERAAVEARSLGLGDL